LFVLFVQLVLENRPLNGLSVVVVIVVVPAAAAAAGVVEAVAVAAVCFCFFYFIFGLCGIDQAARGCMTGDFIRAL